MTFENPCDFHLNKGFKQVIVIRLTDPISLIGCEIQVFSNNDSRDRIRTQWDGRLNN